MAFDINNLLGSLTQAAGAENKMIADARQQMDQETAQISNLLQTNQQESAAVAAQAADIAARRAGVDYQRAKTLENAQAILGLNPDDVNNQLGESIATYNEAETQRKASRGQFDQLSQISLLDNPLGWLAAQLQLPQVAAKNNALVDQRDAAAANLQARYSLLNAHKSTVTANTADQLKTIDLDTATVKARTAQIELRATQADNISKIGGRNLQSLQLASKIFDNEYKVIDKTLQIGQHQLQAEMLAEQRKANAETTMQRLEKMKKDAAFEAEYNSRLAQISNLLGRAAPMTLAELELLSPEDKRRWVTAAGNARLGESITDAMQMVARADQKAILATNPGFASSISGYDAQLRAEIDARLKKLGKKSVEQLTKQEYATIREESDAAVTNLFYNSTSGLAGRSMLDPVFDTKFNPYKIRHTAMLDMIANSDQLPQLKNNLMVQALNTVAQATTERTYDGNLQAEQFKQAISSVIAGINNKTVSPERAAADLVAYIRAGSAANLGYYQYTNVGLVPNRNYVIDTGIKSVKGGTVKFDGMSELQTKAGLIDAAISATKNRAIEAFGLGNPAMLLTEPDIYGISR